MTQKQVTCFSNGYVGNAGDGPSVQELLKDLIARIEVLEEKLAVSDAAPEVNAVRGNSQLVMRMSPMN